MKIIDSILQSEYFTDQPPVLIDIGASGEINSKWKVIAPYCICLAYDADDREFHVTEETNKAYKKLVTFNRIVTAIPIDQADFYLTASPFCSSLLEPDKEKLAPWIFSPLFSVNKVTRLQAITIADSLKLANIGYIDWFKTDTQGTDLRLFTSLPPHLQSGISAAEFEPGILDAYKGEDKLYSVMQEMHEKGFWLSSIAVKGVQRLHNGYAGQFGSFLARRVIRTTPGWAEVTYLRQPAIDATARSTGSESQSPYPSRQSRDALRQLLLLYIFSLLDKQYGFALEIADFALKEYPTDLFRQCRTAVFKKIKGEKWKTPLIIIKRQLNKLFSSLHD